MATINTVNFDDLFDFSPEPLELQSSPNPHASIAATAAVPSIVKEESSSPISGATVSGSAGSTAENITVAAVDAASGGAQGTLQLLSQSVPTNWGGGSQPQLIQHQQQHLHQQQHQPPAGFNTSVDQLLATLPEASTTSAAVSPPPPALPPRAASFSAGTGPSSSATASSSGGIAKGKRGRKPGSGSGGAKAGNLKSDMKSKLERSRQSARECRARKKLRYQYLDDLILERERANLALLHELLKYNEWCKELDRGRVPDGLREALNPSNDNKMENR